MRITVTFATLLACIPLAGFVFAQESESEIPVLSIFSELGVDENVKVYNEEPVTFMTRSGRPGERVAAARRDLRAFRRRGGRQQ